IGLDAAGAIQPKRLSRTAGGKVFQLLREHPIEEVAAVRDRTGDQQRASGGAVEKRSPPTNRRVLALDIAAGCDHLTRLAVRDVFHHAGEPAADGCAWTISPRWNSTQYSFAHVPLVLSTQRRIMKLHCTS